MHRVRREKFSYSSGPEHIEQLKKAMYEAGIEVGIWWYSME